MKHTIIILLLMFLAIGTTNSLAKPKTVFNASQNTIESLLNGLSSENLGLKSSCAYMIGEFHIEKAVIPLMRILREDENEDMRIVAALALYKIGSPIAINAVRQAIRFDESERVSKHCASFYSDFTKNRFYDEEINKDVAKTALK